MRLQLEHNAVFKGRNQIQKPPTAAGLNRTRK
jgi:hypothetical protein